MQDAVNTYRYDAEGSLISVAGGSTASYVTNALNQRVEATAGGVTDRYSLDLAGRRGTTWASNGTLKLAQYYAGAERLAFWAAADGNIHFEHGDIQGTEFERTSYGDSLESSYTAGPFGEQYTNTGSDLDPAHFALLDQDLAPAAGLSHAQFREYSSIQGRWTADMQRTEFERTSSRSSIIILP